LNSTVSGKTQIYVLISSLLGSDAYWGLSISHFRVKTPFFRRPIYGLFCVTFEENVFQVALKVIIKPLNTQTRELKEIKQELNSSVTSCDRTSRRGRI
jgi:hypothetical protein